MPKSFLIFFIFVIFVSLFGPLPAAAETQDLEILRMRIQILQLQIEILKVQIALLSKGIQLPLATPVLETKNCAQLQISWGWVQGATSYRLYRNGILVYEGTELSFVDSGLTLGQKYKYVVYGLYRGEQGEPSEVYEVVAPNICPPRIPVLYFEAKPCGGQITISWAQDAQATTYELFRGSTKIYSGPLTRFVDSGLSLLQTFDYKIRAGNRGGWSNFSTLASFRSSGVCAPAIPESSYVIPETGQEGTLSAELQVSPGHNIRLWPGFTQSVMAFEVKAVYSDISITRVDLFFNSRAWLYLDKVGLQYAGYTKAEQELSRDSFSRIGSQDIYRLRFENLQVSIKDGFPGVFTVTVDPKETQPSGTPHYITVFLENNSIRGVDGAGIWQYAPETGGGIEGSFVRTFYIEE